MNKYKIVAHMISPDLQDNITCNKEYLADYEKFSQSEDWETKMEFLKKYPIDSDAYEFFNDECEYIFEEDADGIYLFEKVLA